MLLGGAERVRRLHRAGPPRARDRRDAPGPGRGRHEVEGDRAALPRDGPRRVLRAVRLGIPVHGPRRRRTEFVKIICS